MSASPVFSSNRDDFVNKHHVFDQALLPALSEFLRPTKVEGMKGRDQMVRAQGRFIAEDLGRVVAILLESGFTASDEFVFATGDDDPWWRVDAEVVERKFFDRQEPGRETKMKLLRLKDGSGFFQFEEIDI